MDIKRFSIKIRLMLKKLVLDIRRSHLRDLRNQVLLYLKKLPDIIHLRNLVFVSTILSVVIMVMFVQRFDALHIYYQKEAPAYGGVYTEGVVGNIEKINPLFIQNDAEASACRLIFSGLTRVDPNNKIVPDLAQSWTIQDNGQIYTFKLKKNEKWQDGKPLTADDVIYTIDLIQNPDTRTSQSSVWQNIKVQKLNDYEVKFTLPNGFNNFLETASQPILPEHLLANINPQDIKVAAFNMDPIGSGPYKFVNFDQAGNETKVILEANQSFLPHRPYIKAVNLRLYNNFTELYDGLLRKQVDGVAQIPFNEINNINRLGALNVYSFYLPRYQVLDFNLKNSFLSQLQVRQAIQDTINRKEIINKGLLGNAMPVYAPILPGYEGYDPSLNKNTYSLKQANDLLTQAGWVMVKGKREKDGKVLTLKLVYSNDAESEAVGKLVTQALTGVGINVEITVADSLLFQAEYIRPRNFDIILTGEYVGADSDLYSFWESNQINDPGINITGFSDPKVDKLIELGRESSNKSDISSDYSQAEASILADTPAVYLYNPIYTMAASNKVKNFYEGSFSNPIDHFNNIDDWYVSTTIKN